MYSAYPSIALACWKTSKGSFPGISSIQIIDDLLSFAQGVVDAARLEMCIDSFQITLGGSSLGGRKCARVSQFLVDFFDKLNHPRITATFDYPGLEVEYRCPTKHRS
jgi:hypothetical protein